MDEARIIISRKEAHAAGFTRYFTATPCGRGHVAERTTSKRECVECKKENGQSRRLSGVKRLSDAKYREANRKEFNAKTLTCYYAKRDQRLIQMREYSEKNSAAAVARAVAWNKTHPESKRTSVRNRRARLRNAPGKHTRQDIETLYQEQNGACVYCRTSLVNGYEVDHIIAISKGGANDRSNLQLLCGPCNRKKSDR